MRIAATASTAHAHVLSSIVAVAVVLTSAGSALGQQRLQPLGPDSPEPTSNPPAVLQYVLTSPPSPIMHRAVASFELMREAGLIEESVTLTALISGASDRVQPFRTDALPIEVGMMLNKTFRLALRQVQRRPSCTGLFSQLGSNGAVLMATTVYLLPTGGQAARLCQQGAAAYTTLGNPVTFLCPAFGTLPRTEAATILIHEALHYAGMSERPADPGGLSPSEINHLVAGSCGF